MRGKTSGETRHNYEGVVGLGNVGGNVPWHLEVTNELAGRLVGELGGRVDEIARLRGCSRIVLLGEPTAPVRTIFAWVPRRTVGCKFSRWIERLIKAGASRKPGAFRKKMLEYTVKIPRGQRKSPDSLETGYKITTGGT